MKKVLVTGTRGFIGSYLMNELAKQKIEAVAFEGDVAHEDDWQKYEGKGINAVVHLAAISIITPGEELGHLYRSNVGGTLCALTFCASQHARIVFPSTNVYGMPKQLPVPENHPIHPTSAYARTKRLSEELIQAASRDFDVVAVILRLGNIYGPGQRVDFLVPTIIKQAKTGTVILRNNHTRRDFVYIDDLLAAIMLSLDHGTRGCKVFNIGTGKSTSVAAIVAMLQEISGGFTAAYENKSPVDGIDDFCLDAHRAKSLLGWEPKISLANGLRMTWEGNKD